MLSEPCHALFEVRAHYGFIAAESRNLNILLADINAPKSTTIWGFGIDALVSLPGVPIGFGVRYEIYERKKSTASSNFGRYDYDTGFSRIAMLVNYRLLDERIFLGPIAGIGISNDVFYRYNTENGNDGSYKTIGGTSLSLGMEGGMKLSSLILGAEAGYLFANFKTPKAGGAKLNTNGGEEVNLDFSGFYSMLHVGATW